MLSKQTDKQAFIFLKDVSFPDLKALVDYMYKGEVNVAQEHLASFLQTAEALDIKGIFENENQVFYGTIRGQISYLGLAYKEDTEQSTSSKFKSSQNTRSSVKRTNESLSNTSSSHATTASNTQKLESNHNQSHQNHSARPRPPPNKKLHTMATESVDQRNLDSDDHFIAVDHKLETENDPDQLEDQFENNGAGWASQVLEDRLLTVKKKHF